MIKRKIESWSNQKKLERIASQVRPQTLARVKILFGPSFSIHHTQKIHDILLSAALVARGAKLAYLSAPFGLPICKDCANIAQLLKMDAVYCKFCQRFQRNDANLIDHMKKFSEIFTPQDFVKPADLQGMTEQIQRLSETELRSFSQDGSPLGSYALNILRNLEYVGDEKLIPNYLEALRKIVVTQMIYYQYFKEAISAVKPDIIVSHDAFYSPWRILYDLAKQRNIPFYNYYPGMRKNTFHFVKDRISMLLNVDELFEKWKGRKIKDSEISVLDKTLADRKKGKIYKGTMIWKKNEKEKTKFEQFISSGKPMAGLYSNVLWDLAALDREVVFDSVKETFLETIRFFAMHPQYNLVVKPHPDELHAVHTAREKLTDLIQTEFPSLPENILILYPKSSITAYDLIPKTRVSIVYTTTVGIESAMIGTPAIVLGDVYYRKKGFTYDPQTPEEFFSTLEKLLRSRDEKTLEIQQDLARKYYYLSFFVYYHDYDVIKFDMHGKISIKPKNLQELLKRKDFMKIVDAIMSKQPIPYFDEGIGA